MFQDKNFDEEAGMKEKATQRDLEIHVNMEAWNMFFWYPIPHPPDEEMIIPEETTSAYHMKLLLPWFLVKMYTFKEDEPGSHLIWGHEWLAEWSGDQSDLERAEEDQLNSNDDAGNEVPVPVPEASGDASSVQALT